MKRSIHHNRTMLLIMGLLSLSMAIQNGHAHQFNVGGSGDWSISSSSSFDQWAHKCRFQIGDTLWFNYQANRDSVLQVTETDYNTCNTSSPIAKYSDGHTMIKLNQSGPHYFISGIVDHCKHNEKIVIIVLADRTKHSSTPPPAPTPTPAPTSEEIPSPPPAPGAPAPSHQTPAPAPSDNMPPPPPPSSASSIIVNFVGAFVGFSLFLNF
ncbi:early nodulin-like protein 9 [Rutidosis leptorrhynchoides]|uniref:early nodulin-like protein 9 n=1 Tax=Rutidosis leptorrhynchoides TaxID=125765 RepID=UPI003A9A220D